MLCEAAKMEKGRELLEALLLEYERKDAANGQKIKIFNADIAFLKKELNIK